MAAAVDLALILQQRQVGRVAVGLVDLDILQALLELAAGWVAMASQPAHPIDIMVVAVPDQEPTEPVPIQLSAAMAVTD